MFSIWRLFFVQIHVMYNVFSWQIVKRYDIIVLIIYCETKVWLISILITTKQGLELMIIFQVWSGKTISKMAITKKNQVNKKSWKRRPPQREVFFKYPNFIRSFCKVVGALRFSYITFFTYAPKSSKSYFVLNILKLDDFMFLTKTLCQMFFKFV